MAIAAALNVLVTSPSEQLKNDLKNNGLTIAQFRRTLTSEFESATKKAKSDIKSMAAAVDVALKNGVVAATEHGEAMKRLGAAYGYVHNGGASYSAMLKDANAIMDRHQVETGQTVDRMKQLDWMFKANKISAHALTEEIKSMTAAQARIKPTANFGREVSAIAARSVKPETTFAQGRRALDRAWITGAINDTKQYNTELGRLRKNLEDASGVTAVNAEADKRRKLDAAAAAEDAAKVEANRNRMIAEATTLTTKHYSAEQQLFATKAKLNRLLAHQTISQATYNAELAIANKLYREQASLTGKLGLTASSFKSATAFVNPWFGVALGIGAAIKEGAAFEKNMSRLGALAETTNAEFTRLIDKANELGRETVFSAGDAAEGMTELARSGFKADEIMQSIPATMRLAAIGEIEVAEASKIASQIMAGMGIEAGELADVVDSMAVATTNSVSSVEDLGEALKFVGPAAKQANQDIEDVMSAIMILSNSGMQGEMGGTALRNLFFSMSDQTDKAQAEIKRLGITFHDLKGEILPLVDIIRQYEKTMDGMSGGDKLKSFGQIFPNRSAVAMASLVGTGSEEFEEMLRLQNERDGLAKRLEEQINDNLIGDFERLGSTISTVSNDLYNSGVGGILRFLANSLTFTVNVVEFFYQSIKMVGQAILTAASGFVYGLLSLIPESVRPGWLDDLTDSIGDFASSGIDAMQKTSDAMEKAMKDGLESANRAVGNASPVEDIQAKIDRNEKEQAEARQRGVQAAIEAQAALDANERAQAFIESLQKQSKGFDDVGAGAKELDEILKSTASTADKAAASFEFWALPIKKAASEQAKMLADARRVAESVGKTTGEKLLMDGDNFATRIVAGGIDFWEQRQAVSQATLDIERELAELQWRRDFAAANGREATSREQAAWAASKNATDQERQRLDLITSQAEALERQAQAREKERDKLRSDAETVKQNATELKKQFDPMIGFKEEFTKLSVMKGAGLIGDKTFNDAVTNLENETLKKAGPRNIGYAGAVEAGSAEAYSASLAKISNPEFDELKRQTAEMKTHGQTLRDIRTGVNRQAKGEEILQTL